MKHYERTRGTMIPEVDCSCAATSEHPHLHVIVAGSENISAVSSKLHTKTVKGSDEFLVRPRCYFLVKSPRNHSPGLNFEDLKLKPYSISSLNPSANRKQLSIWGER